MYAAKRCPPRVLLPKIIFSSFAGAWPAPSLYVCAARSGNPSLISFEQFSFAKKKESRDEETIPN
jgi:hypothetical protein